MSLRSRLILAFLLLAVVPLTQGYAKAQIELQEGAEPFDDATMMALRVGR